VKQQNERNIILTNSRFKTLLLLALPLILAAGCASNPANSYFTDTLVPTTAAVSGRQAANQFIANEIYEMYLTNTNSAYSMVASVNEEVVTLQGPLSYDGEQKPGRVERRGIDDRIWKLAGVNRVKDELGVDTVLILAEKPVAGR
jgi:hypothetical protein